MRYLALALLALLALVVVATLHYTLPQNDVVRIVNTEVRRVDLGPRSRFFWSRSDAGATMSDSRDVRFIETIQPDGDPMVFRNEDTGWGWPPYFKFDSSNLQARAQDLVSSREVPVWVAVRHYGWRSEVFSIFPNALAVAQVEGPDARVFPWRMITALVGLVIVLILLGVLARLLKIALWDPVRERFRRRPR
jgi:heme A synthase